METRIQYVLVGIFVLVLGSAGIGISLWLAFGDFAKDYRIYQLNMTESVSGLYVDSPVKYRGVEVGKVSRLNLDPANPEQVIVLLEIEPAIPIHEDTIATLKVQGLTGIASVELSGGTAESPLLKARPGEKHPVIQTGPSLFSRFDATITELIGNLNLVAHDLHALMEPTNRENVRKLLANMADVTAAFSAQRNELEQGIADFSRFSGQAAEIGDSLPELLDKLGGSAEQFRAMAEEFTAAGRALRSQVEMSGDAVQRLSVDTVPEVQRLVGELESLSSSMQQLADRLERDPSQIIYGPAPVPRGPGE